MITAFIARTRLRQVLGLMEDERHALLDGPLSSLSEIAAKRLLILDSLEKGGPVARKVLGDGLQHLRSLAKRNKKLFEASLAGMNAATETLQLLEQNLNVMETYTPLGKKVSVSQKTSKKDHRI